MRSRFARAKRNDSDRIRRSVVRDIRRSEFRRSEIRRLDFGRPNRPSSKLGDARGREGENRPSSESSPFCGIEASSKSQCAKSQVLTGSHL